MKIIRIVFELDFGGVESVIQMSTAFFQIKPDIDHQVLVLGKGGRVEKVILNQGGLVQVLDAQPKIPNVGLIFLLKDYLKIHKPYVVHMVGAEANFHGLIAAKLAGVPIRIGEEIGFPKHNFLYRLLFKFTYQFAHQVICVSEAVRTHLYQLGELPLSKSKVIYNPVERPQIHARKEVKKSFVFMTVSRLSAIKNISCVILALTEIVKETDYKPRLMIVGDGEEREKLENLVTQNQMTAYVSFEGYQPIIFNFLALADVFLLPSFSEGSSLALAEAMHIGLPAVVTQVGGAAEIIGDSNSAIFVNPKSLPEIKAAMLAFLRMDKAEREKMGKRAHLQAQNFSVDNYCHHLLALYDSQKQHG